MASTQAEILAIDKQIAALEGDIACLQPRLDATKTARLSRFLRRTSSRIITILPKTLQHNKFSTIEKEFSVLEVECLRLQAQLFVVKKGRNRCAPLCRIPDELLSRILAHTQVSPMHHSDTAYHTRLFNFFFNARWQEVGLVCSHIYEVSISSPELWTYISVDWPTSQISTYLSRSGNFSLVLNWLPRRDALWDEILALGGSRFTRSHAVSVTNGSIYGRVTQGIEQAIHMHGPSHENQSNSHVSILHVSHGDHFTDWLHVLSLYPALVEMSITRASMKAHAHTNAHAPVLTTILPPTPNFPLLSRLHLDRMIGYHSLQPLFELLHSTPCLTELVISEFITDCAPHPDVHEERKVELPLLRSLVLVSLRPEIICCFIVALSLHLPLLEELVVEGALRPHGHLWPSEFRDVFPVVIALWNNVASARTTTASGGTTDTEACASLSLVGQYIWNPSSGNGDKNILWLEVQHRDPAPGLKFRLRTLYDVDHHHEELFQAHNIDFDTLQINGLMPGSRGWRSTPWTARLDEILERIRAGRGMDQEHGIMRLRFIKCLVEVPGLEDWVRVQASRNIRVVNTIEFVGCGDDGPTMADYEALRDSRVVENVKWI
jgi:hypothetical protein